MVNERARALVFGALTLATHLPATNASSNWGVCTKDQNGKQDCKNRIPRGAKIAIAVVCIIVLLLVLGLVICVIANRRRAAASEREYNVEASQMDGPPTIIATEYNPRSGPSPVYGVDGPKAARFAIGNLSPSPQVSGPRFPSATHQYNNSNAYYYNSNAPEPQMSQTRTAPVSQASFTQNKQPYPFNGISSRGPSPPKTAFMTHGFPRPVLAGERLKDRLKERPASVSMISTLPEPLQQHQYP